MFDINYYWLKANNALGKILKIDFPLSFYGRISYKEKARVMLRLMFLIVLPSFLFIIFFIILFSIIDFKPKSSFAFHIIMLPWCLVFWIMLASAVKRGHDRNMSAWPFLVLLVLQAMLIAITGLIIRFEPSWSKINICFIANFEKCDEIDTRLTLEMLGALPTMIWMIRYVFAMGIMGSAPGADRFGPPPKEKDSYLRGPSKLNNNPWYYWY